MYVSIILQRLQVSFSTSTVLLLLWLWLFRVYVVLLFYLFLHTTILHCTHTSAAPTEFETKLFQIHRPWTKNTVDDTHDVTFICAQQWKPIPETYHSRCSKTCNEVILVNGRVIVIIIRIDHNIIHIRFWQRQYVLYSCAIIITLSCYTTHAHVFATYELVLKFHAEHNTQY